VALHVSQNPAKPTAWKTHPWLSKGRCWAFEFLHRILGIDPLRTQKSELAA
jgi:hypothetical protein